MSKNLHVSLQNRPKKSTTYCKSKGNQTLQMCLSRNYDFVFTNLLKNEAELMSLTTKFLLSENGQPLTKSQFLECTNLLINIDWLFITA